jgi:hypothetical protein
VEPPGLKIACWDWVQGREGRLSVVWSSWAGTLHSAAVADLDLRDESKNAGGDISNGGEEPGSFEVYRVGRRRPA